MNEYETKRLEKIKQNQELLAELDIKPVIATRPRAQDSKPPAKKRKLLQEIAPSRTSARIAAGPSKQNYNEDEASNPTRLPRSATKKSKTGHSRAAPAPTADLDNPVPAKNIQTIQSNWTNWQPSAPAPTRDANQVWHFRDHADFTPNKSPEEMLREGCFGGSYYRPLRSRKLGVVVAEDWKELPPEWIAGLSVETFLTSPEYDPDVNKFKVACGQSIEEWEAAGWISHEHDVRGWFQWYTRFFRGRRCDDDARQVSRWKKCVGETGRWRRMLLKKYMQLGVREVFDDGADEDPVEVSPVMHQTCHHWAFEVRQEHLDAYWATGGR